MPANPRLLLHALLSLLLAGTLSACGTLALRDPLRIDLVGLEPLPGQGLEMRFALKLRIQNPNDAALDYDGVALELEVNGQPLASGVSDQQGQVPRFGEALLSVPVSISAFSAMRQAWGAAGYQPGQGLPYALSGKLAAGLFGTTRFEDQGVLHWPAPKTTP
ncbi:LEA type 2 family protein [Pseudomonas sp. MBLB4123]|uniref:LEA type 2 family protein n=1 Tax=Pseudomonas sp. MBLB4123 TaxID=3451557 RepID=UPI003F7566A4